MQSSRQEFGQVEAVVGLPLHLSGMDVTVVFSGLPAVPDPGL